MQGLIGLGSLLRKMKAVFTLDSLFGLGYHVFMGKDRKTTRFVTAYDHHCRKRHEHHRDKNEIIQFIVQLEVLIEKHWYPVIRYDTAHDFAHCDIIHWNGKTEKINIPSLDFKEALTYADKDISENWQTYINRFLKEVSDDQGQ